MTTLTFAQLSADLLRIHAHGLTETNVIALQHTAGGKIYAETDTSELEADLAEANADAERETKSAEAAWERVGEKTDEIRKLEAKNAELQPQILKLEGHA